MKTRRSLLLALLVCAALLFSSSALAQFSQQGPKFVGTDAVGASSQGGSVSLSADGNTAIVGGSGDNAGTGAAWVWTRNAGVWTQQSNKLVGSDSTGAALGYAVALSADGNTAIVGGPADNNNDGAAWVWTRSAGVWTQQGPKLVTSGSGSAEQGFAVALSADGNTAIVGAPGDSNNDGAAMVWTRTGGAWTQQGPNLIGSGSAANAGQGSAVALSSDGNTAIIAGPGDNNNEGAVWAWTRIGGVWTQQGPKLVGSGAANGTLGSEQGYSVDLSGDGNTAILGGPLDEIFGAGAVWVWTRNEGVWTQQGPKLQLLGTDSSNANQGFSVSLSADGNTAIVGGPQSDDSLGAAWVWTRSGGIWSQQGTKLRGSDAGPAAQGSSVSLSADGKTAIVGGPTDTALVSGDSVARGAAWVFTAGADLSVSKSASGAPPFTAGGNLNYMISVANSGPSAASSVVVTDTLPAATTFVSATPSQGSCSRTSSTVSCALGILTNSGSATINIVVKTSSTPGTVSNTATVSAAGSDPNPGNNTATSTIVTIAPSSRRRAVIQH